MRITENLLSSGEVLPKTQGTEPGAVVLEEPGPGKVTHVAENITSMLPNQGKDWSLL